MSPQAFNRYMLVIGMGRNRKLVQLSDSEFRAHVAGVLSLAAQAPIRGYFLVGDQEPTPEHVLNEAGGKVTARVARNTIAKLKAEGVLEYDDELGAWFIHDWWDVNPEPRKDDTNADRQRRFRERRKAARNGAGNGVTSNGSNADVTRTEGHAGGPSSSTSPSLSSTNDNSNGNPARKPARLDQSSPPDDLPAEHLPVLAEALVILHRIWDQRGGHIEPQQRGVGLGMQRNLRADHLDVARRLEHWFISGKGRRASTADIAKRFGDWCADEPAGAAPRTAAAPVGGYDRERAERAQALQDRIARSGLAL